MSQKEGTVSKAVADKINMAMSYYLDSEDPPSAPEQSEYVKPPPAPPAPVSKKSTSSYSTQGIRGTQGRVSPPPVSPTLSSAAKMNAHEAPPAPSEYVPPSYPRGKTSSTKVRRPASNVGNNRAGRNQLSPDRTEVAGSRLYARAKQQKKLHDERLLKNPHGCTFSPSFSTSASSRGSVKGKGRFRGGMSESKSGQERFECLYMNAQSIAEKKERSTLREHMNPAGCTFSPEFVAKAHRKRDEALGQSRLDALYNDAKKIKAKLEMKKAEEVQSAPGFSPQITRKGKKVSQYRTREGQDFSRRLYRDIEGTESKYKRLEAKKKQIETSGCTFTPKVRRSASAPKSRPSWKNDESANMDVSDRLYSYNTKLTAKRALLVEQNEAQIERETPFKPNLSTNIYNRVHHIEGTGGSLQAGHVFERLTQKGSYQEKSARREALLREEAKIYTFKPQIPKRRSRSAPKTRPSWQEENGGDDEDVPVYDRLYSNRHHKDEIIVEAKENQFMQEMKECTFSPSIPLKLEEKTKISSRTPVWERLYDDKMSIQLLREEIKAQKELTGCTFQPKSNRKRLVNGRWQDTIESEYAAAVHDRLTKVDLQKRAEMLEKEKEALELKDCTFAPDLSNTNADVVLKMSGKVKSRLSGSIYDRLHEDAKMQKIVLENMKRELVKKELRECTFQPQIGVDIDDDSSVDTGKSGLRIEKLAEPKAINDKRFNLESQNLREKYRRPPPRTKKGGISDKSANNIIKSLVDAQGAVAAANRIAQTSASEVSMDDGDMDMTDKNFVVSTPAGGGHTTPAPANNPLSMSDLEDRAEPVAENVKPHGSTLSEAPKDTTTPARVVQVDELSEGTPEEEKNKAPDEQLADFERWQAEMEAKLAG